MACTAGRSSSRIGSMRTLTGGRATIHLPALGADAARQRHVFGHERRRGRRRRRGRAARRPGASSAAAEPGAGGLAARRRLPPARDRRGRRRRARSPVARSGSVPAGQQARRLRRRGPARDPTGRPAGAGRGRRPTAPVRAPPRGAPRRSTIPTIGTPRPCASPLAVAIPTRRPVNAPGPVAGNACPRRAKRAGDRRDRCRRPHDENRMRRARRLGRLDPGGASHLPSRRQTDLERATRHVHPGALPPGMHVVGAANGAMSSPLPERRECAGSLLAVEAGSGLPRRRAAGEGRACGNYAALAREGAPRKPSWISRTTSRLKISRSPTAKASARSSI